MDNQTQVKLEDLDLFKLLRLSHLSDEQKREYTQKILELAFAEIAAEDLPQYLTEEEITQFTQMASDPSTKDQALEFLKSKFPNFDEFLKTKMLGIKKDLVLANIEERLEINKAESSNPDAPAEKENLEKTLAAIQADDWGTVDQLIQSTN